MSVVICPAFGTSPFSIFQSQLILPAACARIHDKPASTGSLVALYERRTVLGAHERKLVTSLAGPKSEVLRPHLRCQLWISLDILIPLVSEGFKRVQCQLFVRSGVNGFQIVHEFFDVFVWEIFSGIAQLMNYTVLYFRFQEYCIYRGSESFKVDCTWYEYIFYASVLLVVQYWSPMSDEAGQALPGAFVSSYTHTAYVFTYHSNLWLLVCIRLSLLSSLRFWRGNVWRLDRLLHRQGSRGRCCHSLANGGILSVMQLTVVSDTERCRIYPWHVLKYRRYSYTLCIVRWLSP